MNRPLVLGFVGGATFVVSLVFALFVSDGLTDSGDGEVRLPGALGDPVELAASQDITDPQQPLLDEAFVPTGVAYLPVASSDDLFPGSPTGSSDPGGGTGSTDTTTGSGADSGTGTTDTTTNGSTTTTGSGAGSGTGTDGGTTTTSSGSDSGTRTTDSTEDGSDTTSGTSAGSDGSAADGPLVEELEIPEIPAGFFSPDLYFEILRFGPFRFVDLCAEGTEAPGCPPGVPGTILAPLDHDGYHGLGDFRLGARLGLAPADVECVGYDESQPADIQHPLYVWSNHPAALVIEDAPRGNIRDIRTREVRSDDPDHPEFIRFADAAAEERLATSPWPRHCFVLIERSYTVGWLPNFTVLVEGTSFLGETATRAYSFEVPDGRRPPVAYEVLNDHDVRVYVPVKRPGMGAFVSVIEASEPETCADLERRRGFGEMIPGGPGRFMLDWGQQDSESVLSGSVRYDASFNARQVVNVLGLREGTPHRVCIWWTEARDRSFDEAPIVEREVRTIITPNRLTGEIVLSEIVNRSGSPLPAGSVTVRLRCPPGGAPSQSHPALGDGDGHTLPVALVVCDWGGLGSENPTTGQVELDDGTRHEIALPTDPSAARGVQRFTIDLSTDSQPGPTLIFRAVWLEGADAGGEGWILSEINQFEPPDTDPPGLPADPRIDHFNTRVEPGDVGEILVTISFDRPVQVDASMEGGSTLGTPCLTGPAPTYTSSGFVATHTFGFVDLCPTEAYTFLVTAEARDGTVATFADTTLSPPVDATYAGLTGRAGGYVVTYNVFTTGPPRAISRFDKLMHYSVAFGFRSYDLRQDHGCFVDTAGPGPPVGGSDQWGDELEVQIGFLVIEQARHGAVPMECSPRNGFGNSHWHASVTHTVTGIGDLEDGEFEFTIPFEARDVIGGAPPLSVELIVRGTIRR